MRKLMWFTVGFALSCAFGAYVLSGNLLAVIAIALLTCCGGVWLLCRHFGWKFIPLTILLGMVTGLMWYWVYDGAYLSPASELDGQTTYATLEVLDYGFNTEYGVAADGNASWQGKTYRIRFYLDGQRPLLPGDLVSGQFRFRITHEGMEESTYHRGNGIMLLAYEVGEAEITHQETPLWHYPAAHLRQYLIGLIQSIFPEDTEAFARALLLGDDNDIRYELNTAFKVSGIRHIIAVSGLHVSILFGVVYILSGKRRVLTALIGIPVLILFAAVAGFTPSVIRACVMHGLMILAMLFNREYDPPTALSFAALSMLVANPLAITSVSFQLSVGCMAGIFLFAEKIKNWLLEENHLGHAKGKDLVSALVRGFSGSVAVSLGAVSITTPLSALYFGAVSLISPLTNLLTLWVVTIVFYGVMAACLVGMFWNAGAAGLAWLVSWPIRYIMELTGLLAKFPLAAVYTRSDLVVLWLGICYVLLILFLLMKHRRPLFFTCTALISLCMVLLISWTEPMRDSFRMTVLDVGQGQSIILQSDGKTYLVDCGGSYADDAADVAAETLLSMGISRIDGLILTHYDTDHAGGAEMLLSRIRADALYLPAWEDERDTENALSAYRDGSVNLMEQDMELLWEDTKITLITSEIRDSGNESSLCVLFQAGDYDILITGDRGSLGEKLLMQRYALPKLDVLVVGHHGSKYSTSSELLEVTQPRVAVISVEEGNRYGHPAPELLERLRAAGCEIYRTDEDGTVIIRG